MPSELISSVTARQDKAAFVRFERVPIEDKEQSVKQGKYVAKEIDYVYLTPPYSKDEVVHKVSFWLDENARKVNDGRMKLEVSEHYRTAYEAWKKGHELPLNGTPIKGWGIISPAMQEQLIHLKIMTVEDLAGINDQGAAMIGMGARDLQTKAKTWLATLQDRGPVTMELAHYKQKAEVQTMQIATMTQQLAALTAQVGELLRKVPSAPAVVMPPVEPRVQEPEITVTIPAARDDGEEI